MRVVIAPDKFAGTLGAVAAAEAIAAGWRRVAPGDDLDLVPLADGGPGFVEVLRTAAGGQVREVRVTGPLGDPVAAWFLLSGGDESSQVEYRTAYIEAAQACGLDLVPPDGRDVAAASTYGVGELADAAIRAGARTLVVGLGGSATNDGGAGMLAALGAVATAPDTRRAGPIEKNKTGMLRRGTLALNSLEGVDVRPALSRVRGRRLIAATDVDNPLLGPHGASAVFGPQKGAAPELVAQLEQALQRWAELTDPDGADRPGAGAAGGLGHALFLLGARRESGITAVLRAVGLAERLRSADLVITGEGSFDSQSLRGKVVSGVAEAAAAVPSPVPCLVFAGQVTVGKHEMNTAGIASACSLVDSAGSVSAAMSRPAEELAALAERTARQWSPG